MDNIKKHFNLKINESPPQIMRLKWCIAGFEPMKGISSYLLLHVCDNLVVPGKSFLDSSTNIKLSVFY